MNEEEFIIDFYSCDDEEQFLKDIYHNLNCLQQENKMLKENTEHNDKVVDKVNWKNQLLKKENKQLKDNWNKLKDYIVKEYYIHLPLEASTTSIIILINKMQEIEGGINE